MRTFSIFFSLPLQVSFFKQRVLRRCASSVTSSLSKRVNNLPCFQMEMDIDLNCIDEGEGFGEMHEVLSQMSETSVSQKSKKARPARDPETNLTWDAVRKRRLTERFNEMLFDRGFAYRVDSVSPSHFLTDFLFQCFRLSVSPISRLPTSFTVVRNT